MMPTFSAPSPVLAFEALAQKIEDFRGISDNDLALDYLSRSIGEMCGETTPAAGGARSWMDLFVNTPFYLVNAVG
jgi:predicted membrane chloride channel (bestrophin family)